MPNIGDIVLGTEIGRKEGDRKYIYALCSNCGIPRWVQLHGGKPQNETCAKCGLQHTKRAFSHKYDTSKHPCIPTKSHWWLIESQNGETSCGVCKFCGAERVFFNSSHEANESKIKIAPHSEEPYYTIGYKKRKLSTSGNILMRNID